ncbi:alpha/beta fold hydrolase [Sulfitobacter mediterraneus]|uniref:alpha/beta fold hydrolase n=1 Tax=Sulfitobacter mediterraneus TaxID=83219 RepID=UPI0021A2F0D5|nr:alpha/beta fold hydrolase [Sulfitobacter mediterraneus]UWR13386.1 alpha/beta fold hydrolase [Sulfitobacter mediterraneus]
MTPMNRRTLFKAGIVTGAAALAAPHLAGAQTGSGLTFCLVHGAWHGGWAWEPTVQVLRAQGHRATAPSLPGMGDRRADASGEITLADHTQAIADHLFMQDLTDVILVAHSYAGCVLSDLLGQGEDRIAHAVYFDALVPGDGQSLSTFVPEEVRKGMQGAAAAGKLHPVRPKETWEGLWGLMGTLADFAEPRMSSQSAKTFVDPVRGDPFGRQMPRTFIKAAHNPNPLFKKIREDMAARDDFTVVDINGHHDVMAIDGQLTADTLVSVAG